LRLAREHHFPAPEMMALSAVGAGYAMLGRTREGIRALEQSLAMAQQLGFHSFKSNTYCALAQAYLDAGEIDPALARCAEGLRFSSDTGERKLEGELHRVLGDALAARERFDEAEAELRTSLTLSEEHGTLALLPRARLSLARLPARRG
jgi:ATP/maltotriose-dependent transcriptional regulator MalT